MKKENEMKRTLALSLLTVLILALTITACTPAPTGLWKDATYTEDVTLGEGSKTATVVIEAEEKSITVTLKTDEEYLGPALYAVGLINDPSFFDTANGMQLVWEDTHSYWAFFIDGSYATVGAAETAITEGVTYSLVCTKG